LLGRTDATVSAVKKMPSIHSALAVSLGVCIQTWNLRAPVCIYTSCWVLRVNVGLEGPGLGGGLCGRFLRYFFHGWVFLAMCCFPIKHYLLLRLHRQINDCHILLPHPHLRARWLSLQTLWVTRNRNKRLRFLWQLKKLSLVIRR